MGSPLMSLHPPSSDPSLEGAEAASFAETALKLGGKSAEEAKRTGAIDKADDLVEGLFRPEFQTANSPVHRAIWDSEVPIELFEAIPSGPTPAVQKVMDDSCAVVARHKAAGTLLNAEQKISDEVLSDLAKAGYWGLLVDPAYGGAGASFSAFASFITRMATIDATIAGLASVHGCIGAVDPVTSFGTEEQKRRFLPLLASGERLSAFALTEPCAGSDLTALRTTAVRDGDHFVLTGEKLFITNVAPGRLVGVVCLIEGKPAVLVVDLPKEENEHFQLKKYGLYALRHTYNRGIVFNGLRVPAENLLHPKAGNGLTIAYHGLNRGRVALCANAAGTMRAMLADMLPWARFRKTYGAAISTRELVQRRVGRLASLIVACDALTAWCSGLLDAGYRGEMECIIAKIFGAEALKEASIELYMKTHGGRSFLHGHLLGDNIHEFLAPSIYEGEGEMLGMAFFKSLVKQHGTKYFEPVGKALAAANIKRLNPMNPAHLWALRGAAPPYVGWLLRQKLRFGGRINLPPMPSALYEHARYAAKELQRSALEVSGVMSKHQLKLADRQCRMSELSGRIQKMIVMLVSSLYAAKQADKTIQDAADVIGRELRRELRGERASDADFKAVTLLGKKIAEEGSSLLQGVAAADILMPYEND